MSLSSWTMALPAPPMVEATITGSTWELSTQTGTNTSLSVLEHTILMLICVAKHPVFWYKRNADGALEPHEQLRSFNPYLEERDNYTINFKRYDGDDYTIPAIDEYIARIRIDNVTRETVGEYLCVDPSTRYLGETTTAIRLDVHSMPLEDAQYAQIVQSGFAKVLMPYRVPYFKYWKEQLNISIVYTTPANSTFNRTLEMPGFTFDASGFDRSFATNPSDGLALETVSLASGFLSRSTLIIFRDGRTYTSRRGACEFRFQTQLENGSTIERRSTFLLYRNSSSPSKLDEISQRLMSATVTAGQSYEIMMHMGIVDARIARATLQAFEEVPDGGVCRKRHLMANETRAICGVRGFSLINADESASTGRHGGIGLSIFVTPDRPCSFGVGVNLAVGRRSIIARPLITYVSIVAINSTSLKWNVTVSSNDDEFSLDSIGGRIGRFRQESRVLINESLILGCSAPACHPGLAIGWCKLDDRLDKVLACSWIPEEALVELNAEEPRRLSADPSISFTVRNIDRSTVFYEARFDPISYDHNGTFACVMNQLWRPTHEQLAISPEGLFRVIVQHPIAPRFTDRRRFGIDQIVIKRGRFASLTCQVESRPTAEIEWWRNDEPWNSTANQFELSNPSMFRVDREGNFTCVATNRYGTNGRIFEVRFENETNYLSLAIAIPFGVIGLIGVVLIACWWSKRRTMQKFLKHLASNLRSPPAYESIKADLFLNDQTDVLAYNRDFEVARSSFTIDEKSVLGIGEYGIVYKGRYAIGGVVAVKVVKDKTKRTHYVALRDELILLSNIRPHINVLGLVAACTEDLERTGDIFVLTEFCSNGSLLDYLERNRSKFVSGFTNASSGQSLGQPGAVETLLNFSYQAAAGMEHLTALNVMITNSVFRNLPNVQQSIFQIIHRDLALRNIFLNDTHIVKIADFGLAGRRDALKPFGPNQAIPMFWMALESLESPPMGRFDQMSDVWSFGVVLWEMFSCGERPYVEHAADLDRFRMWLRADERSRLGEPRIVCDEMYRLMLACWNSHPRLRPNFSKCKRIIGQILEDQSSSSYQTMVLILSSAWRQMAHRSSQSDSSLPQSPPDSNEDYALNSNIDNEPPIEWTIISPSDIAGDASSSVGSSTPVNSGYIIPRISQDENNQLDSNLF